MLIYNPETKLGKIRDEKRLALKPSIDCKAENCVGGKKTVTVYYSRNVAGYDEKETLKSK